jgi:putative ABC transport system permease protein
MPFLSDLRFALRSFRKSPGFVAVSVATLGLGIGAVTAMFTILSAVLLEPLPYPAAERLVFVRDFQPQLRDLPASYPEYLDWSTLELFDGIGAYWRPSANLTGDGEPERIDVCRITPGLLPLLGIEPLFGRGLKPEDDRPGAEKVALLSHRLWERRFGSDAGILGRSLRVDGESFTVIGVLPEGAEGLTPTELRRASASDLFLPLRMTEETSPRGEHYLTVVARLAPGIGMPRADSEIESAAAALREDGRTEHGILLVEVAERIAGGSRPQLLLLMGGVGLLLLIVCANVANLLLARAHGRERDAAIRAALGASRGRLFGRALGESAILALAGGAWGVVLAFWILRLFSASAGAALLRSGPVSLDLPMMIFALGLTLVTTVLFGAFPALLASRAGVSQSLKEGGRLLGGSAGRHSAARTLVIAEVALAMMLLSGAGLLLTSLRNLRNDELGFDPQGLLSFRLALPEAVYDTFEKQIAFFDRALENVASAPGVEAASIVTVLPVEGGWNSDFEVEGIVWPEGVSPLAETRSVGPDYFRTMRVPLVSGRLLLPSDTRDTANVVVVDEELVRRVFGRENPLGRRIFFGGEESPRHEIVGVVGNVQHWSLGREERPAVYFPYRQHLNSSTMVMVVRTAASPSSLLPRMREAIEAVDPEQPLSQARTLTEVLDQNLAQRGFSTALLAAFAVLAVFLSSLGLYGVVSQTISERTREIGLRVTLGANARDILSMVFAGGGKLVAAGIVFGLAGALLVSRLLETLLFEVAPTDPRVLGGVAVVLCLVAALALYLPARRAARVDPMAALRDV